MWWMPHAPRESDMHRTATKVRHEPAAEAPKRRNPATKGGVQDEEGFRAKRAPGSPEGAELAEPPRSEACDEVVRSCEGAGRQAFLTFEERSEAQPNE